MPRQARNALDWNFASWICEISDLKSQRSCCISVLGCEHFGSIAVLCGALIPTWPVLSQSVLCHFALNRSDIFFFYFIHKKLKTDYNLSRRNPQLESLIKPSKLGER